MEFFYDCTIPPSSQEVGLAGTGSWLKSDPPKRFSKGCPYRFQGVPHELAFRRVLYASSLSAGRDHVLYAFTSTLLSGPIPAGNGG
ncbi:unnamed protein product [Cuscuta campestris]|uniref:Uncharacterized protein n=1 Tax=Cuscuta campestris TaxID=132261 RepID=A0A484KMU6_9ASTE|nr:unnamed protein product [Cuscuta campestris]